MQAQSQNEKLARNVVGAFFAQLNPTVEQLEDVKTAVSEAVTNCIVHAYGGRQEGKVHIICQLSERTLCVCITDYGRGIEDVEKAMQPFYTTVSGGERSGMGFTVMQAFCDSVEVQSREGETTVKLTKKVA
ncbi:MAG TPA: anti-sigma F factor [Candidatus Fimimonas merdipullorum]|uniref:Anti-sigma F factor n=1 Tax=Candidatus Fimimonas merdipullorum TaxID=2840822 RepID=A0A9D1SQI4_9BACT|nr:anti-sigma F factor [Candidatus Fimimonas merdipullorum]